MRAEDDIDMTIRKNRALYRAVHRGTKEMDFLLGRFASNCVADMSASDLTVFEELLTFPDPILAEALVDQKGEFSGAINSFLERIRQFHSNRDQR